MDKVNKQDKKPLKARWKAYTNSLDDAAKQRFITFIAYVGVLSLAILSSSFGLLFDIENFNATRFITGVCFNIAFSLIALILSLKDGRLTNQSKKVGELFETKKVFKSKVDQIVDDDAFRQWNDYKYEKEREEYVLNELAAIGIYDWQYLQISEKDLYELMSTPKEDIHFRVSRRDNREDICSLDQITEYQYQVIMLYRQGKYTFNKLNHSYFKNQVGRNDYKYYADNQDKDTKLEFWAFFYRICMIIIFSAIFSLAIINPSESSSSQIIYDTISRIVNVCFSIFFGYSLAHDEAQRLIKSLEFKIGMIEQYLVDITSGIFVPKHRDEIIRAKLDEIRSNKTQNEQPTNNVPPKEEKCLESAKETKIEQKVEETKVEQTDFEEELVINPDDYEYIKAMLDVKHKQEQKGHN